METFKALAAPTATVLAALIAAGITFLVAVFTKEAKTSEFRQAWIEALRDDLAGFVGIWYYLSHEFQRGGENGAVLTDEFWKGIKPEMLRVEELQTRIELRLNPKEHSELIAQVHALARIHEFFGKPFASRKAAIDKLTADSQKVLKAEWGRVKQGEATYRLVKGFAITAVVAALLVLGALWLSAGTGHDRGAQSLPSNNSSKPTPLRGGA